MAFQARVIQDRDDRRRRHGAGSALAGLAAGLQPIVEYYAKQKMLEKDPQYQLAKMKMEYLKSNPGQARRILFGATPEEEVEQAGKMAAAQAKGKETPSVLAERESVLQARKLQQEARKAALEKAEEQEFEQELEAARLVRDVEAYEKSRLAGTPQEVPFKFGVPEAIRLVTTQSLPKEYREDVAARVFGVRETGQYEQLPIALAEYLGDPTVPEENKALAREFADRITKKTAGDTRSSLEKNFDAIMAISKRYGIPMSEQEALSRVTKASKEERPPSLEEYLGKEAPKQMGALGKWPNIKDAVKGLSDLYWATYGSAGWSSATQGKPSPTPSPAPSPGPPTVVKPGGKPYFNPSTGRIEYR